MVVTEWTTLFFVWHYFHFDLNVEKFLLVSDRFLDYYCIWWIGYPVSLYYGHSYVYRDVPTFGFRNWLPKISLLVIYSSPLFTSSKSPFRQNGVLYTERNRWFSLPSVVCNDWRLLIFDLYFVSFSGRHTYDDDHQ